MRIFNRGLLPCLILVCVLLASCEVHQWPVPNNEPQPGAPDTPDPPQPTVYATLRLDLEYLTEMYYWHQAYTGSSTTSTVSKDPDDNYDNLVNLVQGSQLAVTVKVYRNNSNPTLLSTNMFMTELDGNFNTSVEVKVPVGQDCIVVVWSHLSEGDDNWAFYDCSDFYDIKLIRERYDGNTDRRDAFGGRLTTMVPVETTVIETVQMRRPMGKLEFVTTGLKDFLANEKMRLKVSGQDVSVDDYTVVISYPFYYPSAYNAIDDRLGGSSGGYSYSAPLTLNGDNADETSLGFDYVMINTGDDEAVQAQVSIVHKDGTQVASTGMITIPMARDHHTVVRGELLTGNGGGGVGLDPDFDGDFNITM